jgi:hypothetical protein
MNLLVNRVKSISKAGFQFATTFLVVGLFSIATTSEAALIAEEMASPADIDSSEPHLAQSADGSTVLSWLQHSEAGTTLRYSKLDGGHWETAKTVAQGDNWFVNWADFPSVSPISADLWAAHWLVKKTGGTYAYDVFVSLSQDAGETWGTPFTPHKDNTATEHGFVSLYPFQQGVGALWLDGRNMATDGGGHGDGSHGTASDESAEEGPKEEVSKEDTGMTLRAALITPDPDTSTRFLVDGLVCDCCQTDVATGPQGPIAIYRNRTIDEIRDIYVTRWVDGQWTTGESVADDNWHIAGCPVNGPAIAARGDEVVVAWFTGADENPRVRFARSGDQAANFSPAINIAEGTPIGRVDIVLLEDGRAVVSWLHEREEERGHLAIRLVEIDGQIGPVQFIAPTNTSRAAGFPQMVSHGDELLFAWTDTSGDKRRVQTSRVKISSLEN